MHENYSDSGSHKDSEFYPLTPTFGILTPIEKYDQRKKNALKSDHQMLLNARIAAKQRQDSWC